MKTSRMFMGHLFVLRKLELSMNYLIKITIFVTIFQQFPACKFLYLQNGMSCAALLRMFYRFLSCTGNVDVVDEKDH
jgi:hypothetical protein